MLRTGGTLYANGISTVKNCQDFDCTYPLFVLATKHGHLDAAYQVGTYLRMTGAATGRAPKPFSSSAKPPQPSDGELSLSKSTCEGVKWLKHSAEHATTK